MSKTNNRIRTSGERPGMREQLQRFEKQLRGTGHTPKDARRIAIREARKADRRRDG